MSNDDHFRQISTWEPQTSVFHTISQGGETVKKLEFVTRIQVNGVKEEISGAKEKEVVLKSTEKGLQTMHYERKAAG